MSGEVFRPAPQPERVVPPVTSLEEINDRKLEADDLYCHNGAWMLMDHPPETRRIVAGLRAKLSGDDKGTSIENVIQKFLYAYRDIK